MMGMPLASSVIPTKHVSEKTGKGKNSQNRYQKTKPDEVQVDAQGCQQKEI